MDYITSYDSPIGPLTIASDGTAITGLWKDLPGIPRDDLPVFETARAWLDRYFAWDRPDPRILPLSPAGTAFQKQVWALLPAIPWGITKTYGQIARELGKPRACQAVGQAVGRNPIAIMIPCHRIIGADGSLTGYAGGLEMKRQLLNFEQGCERF